MEHKGALEQGRLWLRNRRLRRRLMAAVLILLLAAIALGTWVVNGWLELSVLRFGLFWGGVTLYTLMLLVLSVYDILRVKRGG